MPAIYVKLHPEEDKDIEEFLNGKPKTFIVKEALRMYKGIYEGKMQPVVEKKSNIEDKPEPPKEESKFTTFGGFGPKS
jgi:hypothetical protein